MKKILVLIVAISIVQLTHAQEKTRSYIVDEQLAPRNHNVDFKHMLLEVNFEPEKKLVHGKVTLVFSPLRPQVDSIWIDGIDMKIISLKLNSKDSKFTNYKNGITIYCNPALKWETTDSLNITYDCTPTKGLYFIGWNDPQNISRKQIWSQGQGIDNRNWIPMYDEMNDKMTTEMIVQFDSAYKVLSNGKLLSSKLNKDGTKTWHYLMSHPHAPYLVMLGIGKYDIKEMHSQSGVPLHLYYYPDWKNRADVTYQYSEKMIDFYEKEFGFKYPWESYSQIPVQDFMYGAMENTTATVYGDFLMTDEKGFNDRNYIGVNAHELMHQWFGDCVTARSDAHHWLQESFATYGNMLFEREVFGDDYFNWSRRNGQNASIDESKKNKFQVAHSEAGGTRHYPKGAFVLNMLKYVVGGREVYNKCINHYLKSHPYSNVDTHDLLISFEEVTGMQLDWFFEEWIYKGGEPAYKISYREETGKTIFNVNQTQELSAVTGLPTSGKSAPNSVTTDPFVGDRETDSYRPEGLWKMPIWFEVHYTDGTSDKQQFWIENISQEVTIPNTNSKKIDFVLFDPNNDVMKSVAFEKSFEMLKTQASKATYMLDRYDAVAAMKSTDINAKREFLIQLFDKEKSVQVKNEIVNQFINDKNADSYKLIQKAINDTDVRIQKNVIENTKTIPVELISDYEKLLNGNSYDLILNALEKLCYNNPSKTKQYLEATKNIDGCTGMSVKIKWLEIASAAEPNYAKELVKYTSGSYEFRTRTNAISSLRKLNYFDETLLGNLINAIQSANTRLANPAGDAIVSYYAQSQLKKQIDNYVASQKFDESQRSIISKYIK